MRHVEMAPAKLNLSLRVLGRRDDGFHEIETLMVPVQGLADELLFDLRIGEGEVSLSCDDPELPLDEGNLVLQAVRKFQQVAGLRFAGQIELRKAIPSGAGLGGGSSDAAATLRALASIAGGKLADQLEPMAAEIGSDVPFFLTARPAICRGRGEIITGFDRPIPRAAVVLAKPAFGVPSGWAYSRWASSQELPGAEYGIQEADWGDAANDLERPVFEKYLVLPALKAWLKARPETGVAMMSGSGATVFAVLRDGAAGEELLADLKVEFGSSTWCQCAFIGTAGDRAER